jgi:hypothetical protein
MNASSGWLVQRIVSRGGSAGIGGYPATQIGETTYGRRASSTILELALVDAAAAARGTA